jgi:hypothetical protein
VTQREVFTVARFKCKICHHVFRDRLPDECARRWYASPTIAKSIAALAGGKAAHAVRKIFGFQATNHVDTLSWDALRRWLVAFGDNRLWPAQNGDLGCAPAKHTSLDLAHRAMDFFKRIRRSLLRC